jgi:predicted  nucleic acid-binding Zn-ribbon protein
MTDLAALLTVQELDNGAGALRHRLATLPERKALEDAQNLVVRLDAELAERDGPRRELERQQRRIEDEATALRQKADHEDKRLYSGSVTAVRELQAIQEEITSLRRRAGQLDEQILELMLEIEPLAESVVDLEGRRDAAERDATARTVALAEAEALVAGELREVEARLAAARAEVPPEALARYEALRPTLSPSTVVRLVGSRCEGCPLQMPALEADRIRKLPPGMTDCDECGRLVLH